MTNKEMKKLSRAELLEMLIEQSKRVKELETQLDEANRKLNERAIILQNAGSIAEASLQLSDIFETAQKAADLYLESIKKMASDNPQKELHEK